MKLHWLFSVAMSFILVCSSSAQSAQARKRTNPCERPATSPATGTAKLTLKGGQSVYHEGEIIPLERAFTYSLVQYRPKAGHNSSHFSFCLIPEGRDPLRDDEESGLWGSAGGSFPSGPYEVFDPGVTYMTTWCSMNRGQWRRPARAHLESTFCGWAFPMRSNFKSSPPRRSGR